MFENWQLHVARPVIASVISAALIAVLAFVFTPLKKWIFPGLKIEEYPIICFVEPYSKPNAKERDISVDFYIINLTNKRHSRNELAQILNRLSPKNGTKPAPDLWFEMNRSGRITSIDNHEKDFNENKGRVLASKVADNSFKIEIGFIKERTIMKVTIHFENVVSGKIKGKKINRAAHGSVPFKYEKLQERCYQD